MTRLNFLILAVSISGASFLYSAPSLVCHAISTPSLASLNDDYQHVVAEHERRKQEEARQKQEKEEREKKEKEEQEKDK